MRQNIFVANRDQAPHLLGPTHMCTPTQLNLSYFYMHALVVIALFATVLDSFFAEAILPEAYNATSTTTLMYYESLSRCPRALWSAVARHYSYMADAIAVAARMKRAFTASALQS